MSLVSFGLWLVALAFFGRSLTGCQTERPHIGVLAPGVTYSESGCGTRDLHATPAVYAADTVWCGEFTDSKWTQFEQDTALEYDGTYWCFQTAWDWPEGCAP